MTIPIAEPVESQRIELGGRRYVIVEEAVFERLREAANTRGLEGWAGAPYPGKLTMFAADPSALARRLLTRRRQARMTQAELARRAGIRVETLNRIERGKTSPDYSTIRKLVVAMNAT